MSIIKGDLHFHSTHSACKMGHQTGQLIDYHKGCGIGAVKEMIKVGNIAYKLGYQYIAITNHTQFPTATKPASFEDAHKLLEHHFQISKLNRKHNPKGIKLMSGVETNIINATGQVGLSDDVLKQLDVVIASNHRPTRRLSKNNIKNGFLGVVKNKHVDIIGHLTRFITKLSDSDWQDIINACEQYNKIIEYNINYPLYQSVLKMVARSRLLIAFGTDTHPEMIDRPIRQHITNDIKHAEIAIKYLEGFGINKNRIINTYSWPRVKKILVN
ncbi:hypothetical protein ACFL04_02770 [Patescibacteria group bacterium]